MSERDLLCPWTVLDVTKATLLSRATLDATLLSRALPPIEAGSDIYYTLGTHVRRSADLTSYVVTHNGVVYLIPGQPKSLTYMKNML